MYFFDRPDYRAEWASPSCCQDYLPRNPPVDQDFVIMTMIIMTMITMHMMMMIIIIICSPPFAVSYPIPPFPCSVSLFLLPGQNYFYHRHC